MKIALIAPPYPLDECPSPPLGLCYVAAVCEESGADVEIFDYIVSRYTPEKLRQQLEAFEPDIIGTNSVTMNFKGAAEILCEAKRIRPEAVTIMGGPHATFDVRNTLDRYPGIDLVVLGEGEETIRELLTVIDRRTDWARAKGIAFRDGAHIVSTAPRPLIEDLDALPIPARHLLPISRYHALGFPVSIITSRGCPNRCIFCLGRRMVGYRIRQRSPVRVVDEIEEILRYGFIRLNVADDTFTANKARARAICAEIIRRGLKIGWSSFCRVNTVDAETLAVMRQAGCDSISFGIESGNPEMLKRVQKGITLDQARHAVRLCREAGIEPHASFIAGLPGENRQTLEDTSRFAEELGVEYGYHVLAPFPGTTLREQVEQYDLEILTDNWDLYDANRAIVRTSALSADDIDAFVRAFERTRIARWEEVINRAGAGPGNEADISMVREHHRLKLIFRVLNDDLIEQAGPMAVDGQDPRDVLAQALESATNCPPGVANRLTHWLTKAGYLKAARDNGHVRWYWAETRRPSPPPIPSP